MKLISFRGIAFSLLLAFGSVVPAGQLVSTSAANASSVGAAGDSYLPIVTADGRFVLFASKANNIVPAGISNYVPARLNVYLRDRQSGSNTLVSVNASGTGGGNGDSFPSAISANGRYALFESSAFDLVPGSAGTNPVKQIYLRDLAAGLTTLVSAGTNGGFGNADSSEGTMTPDAHYAAFKSAATNLVANDTNGIPDIFVRDLQAGVTTLASVGATSAARLLPSPPTLLTSGSSSENPVLSADGRYVAFYSTAIYLLSNVTNTGEIFVRDLVNNNTLWASTNAPLLISGAFCPSYAITPDGQYLAYQAIAPLPLLSPIGGGVFRYHLADGSTDLVATNGAVPVSLDPTERVLDISSNGQFLAFTETNRTTSPPQSTGACIQLWNAATGSDTLVSGGLTNANCRFPRLDASGRFVAFVSDEPLTPNADSSLHLYLRDTSSAAIQLVDIDDATGLPFSSGNLAFSFASAGSVLSFCAPDGGLSSSSSEKYDIFARDFSRSTTEVVSSAIAPSQAPWGASAIASTSISSNGQFVVFSSDADGLVPGDTNGSRDIFVHDMLSGSNALVSVALNGTNSGNYGSATPVMSDDGRFVAFCSGATNLVSDATNATLNIYVRDLQSNVTTLVSCDRTGTNQASGLSTAPQISSDGRDVLFYSTALNIVSNSFFVQNAFWRDMRAGETYEIGATNTAFMTPDGSNVVFQVGSAIWLWRAQTHSASMVDSGPLQSLVFVSPDARHAIYRVGLATPWALWIADLVAGTNWSPGSTLPTSHDYAQFSADGRYLVALIEVSNTNQVFLYDLAAGTNLLISQAYDGSGPGDGPCDWPAISGDDRFIAYRSRADNLVPGDNNQQRDVFLYDRRNGVTTLISVSVNGNWSANGLSLQPFFSGDSRTLFFSSWASDLAVGAFNQFSAVFALPISPDSPIAVTNTPLPLNLTGLSLPPLAAGATASNGPTLTWPAVPGAAYEVQFKNSLGDSQWQPLNGRASVVGSQGSVTDTAPLGPQRFYRIISF